MTHTTSRPHACPHEGCGKAFKTEKAVASHARTHTGEKPYRCTFGACERAFSSQGEFSRHRIKTHGVRLRNAQPAAVVGDVCGGFVGVGVGADEVLVAGVCE